jgi:hypothetical protein
VKPQRRRDVDKHSHSPLPWRFAPDEFNFLDDDGNQDSVGSIVADRDGTPDYICRLDDLPQEVQEANASLIVHSVNTLPVLVEALENARIEFANLLANHPHKGDQRMFTAIIADIDAALATAKGETS